MVDLSRVEEVKMLSQMIKLFKRRRGSTEMIEEISKKKWEGGEGEGQEGEERKEKNIFKRSKKTVRSPVKERDEEGRNRLEEMMVKMMGNMKLMRDEIEEGLGGIKREMEDMKKDMQRREESWEAEKRQVESRNWKGN